MKTSVSTRTTSVITTPLCSNQTKLAHKGDTPSTCPQYKPSPSIPSYQHSFRGQRTTKYYVHYLKEKIFNGNQYQIKQYLHKCIIQYLIQELQATSLSRVHLLSIKARCQSNHYCSSTWEHYPVDSHMQPQHPMAAAPSHWSIYCPRLGPCITHLQEKILRRRMPCGFWQRQM